MVTSGQIKRVHSLSFFLHFTFKYSSKASEVHLVRAVEDHNILSKAATHIFYGLCLS